MKFIKSKNSNLDDISILRILYLALMQNDPKFVLDYLHLSDLKTRNQTLTVNLKAISFAKLNRVEDAFNQIEEILNIKSKGNSLNGRILELTVINRNFYFLFVSLICKL